MQKINMIDSLYGRLTVLEEQNLKVLCRCICGEVKWYYRTNVLSGKSQSCGCFRNEQISAANTTHGLSETRTYRIWKTLKMRCDNPQKDHYDRYGGRGITYDPRWQYFKSFLADMGICPEGKELDRKDNNDNYTKENCHWVTHQENCKNRGY